MAEPVSPTSTVRVKRAATGGAVGRLDDGRVVFVRHSLPGELVEVAITDRSRSFARGDAVQVIEASAQRVQAPCHYAHPGGCGGCDLQHASESAQLEWKAAVVAEHLRRIAGVTREVSVVGAGVDAGGSRTRLRCAVTPEGRLAPAFATNWADAAEVELRSIGDGPPFAVVLRESPHGPAHDVRSLDGAPLRDTTRSDVVVDGHRFAVSATSFWQSHQSAPALLIDAVTALADVQPGESAVDLYSGVGLFAVPLAVAVGPQGRVTAVESSAAAAQDARDNAHDLAQLTVREWSVAPRAVNDTVGYRDVVVLDPPRHGLSRGVAPALVRRHPRRIVYVSCDAATFARDLKVFLTGGYTLSDLRVLDLFPMTEHVELVGLLDFASSGVESEHEGDHPGPRGG
jgi:tRNA/tmRNA/rRNA uracil-C5-methylase (TrmA/RlmC/RlmD family)